MASGQGSLCSHILHIVVLTMLMGGVIPSLTGATDEGGSTSDNEGPFMARDISGIYWPMIGRDAFHTGAGVPASKGLRDPAIQWSDQANSTAMGAVASDMKNNVDFSGVDERSVFVLFDSNLTTVFGREGDTGRMAWSMDVRDVFGRLTNTLFVAPALMDTDDDGRVEVLGSMTDGNDYQLILVEPSISLDHSGFTWDRETYLNDLVWISPNGTSGPIRHSSPCVHDLNSDGVEDVLIGTGNRLSAHNGLNGSLMWSLDIGPVGEALSTPAIYPGSGPTNRIVVNSLPSSRQSLKTTLVNFQGAHLKNVSVTLSSPLPHTHTGPVPVPVIGDLTGDGTREILVSYPSLPGAGRVVSYTSSLDQLSTVGPIPGSLESYPAIADIDGDGSAEMMVHTRVYTTPPSLRMASYKVFQNGTTRALWVRDAPGAGTNPLYSPPLTCDLDGNGLNDAIFVGAGRLHAIAWNGAYLWNLTLQTVPFSASGVVGSLGVDQFTDVYIKGYKVTQALIDLQLDGSIEPNIYTDEPEPTEGRPVNLNCLVKNSGPSTARNVLVRFIDRAGPGSEVVVGEDLLEEIDSTAESTVRWTPATSGLHTITVQIDPSNSVLETDETNNNGSTAISVAQAFPDLVVRDIRFIRGDGRQADKVHLVESDPSWIMVVVGNDGDKQVDSFTVEVLVEGEAPAGGERYTTAGSVPPKGELNVTVEWTPPSIPDGQPSRDLTVEVTLDPPPGAVQESDETNNYGMNRTTVKNDTPLGSYMLDGTVLDPQGGPEDGARVVAMLNRTQENLQSTSDEAGEFSFDLAFLDYRDSDVIHIRASKGNAWGEAEKRVYSEDGRGSVTIIETEQPFMSLSLTAIDPTEVEVDPGASNSFRFMAQNMGNLPGNVTLTRTLEGNTSLRTGDIELSSSVFFLEVGGSREVIMEVEVPSKEPPGSTIEIGIDAAMTGDLTAEAALWYSLTVRLQESLQFEMRSPLVQSVDQNVDGSATFEIYLLNTGNVRVEYNVTADDAIGPYADYRRQVGYLEPAQSVLVEVELTVPPSVNVISGGIVLRTGGQGTLWTWSVSVRAVLPDLVAVTPIGFEPVSPVMGDIIRLIATIRNTGDGMAPEFDYEFRDGSELVGSASVPELGPGEEVSVSDVLWEPRTTGEHELELTIDPGQELTETDRSNNKASRTHVFMPDLSIMMARPSAKMLGPGQPFTIMVNVSNEGNAPLSTGYRVTARLGPADGKEIGSMASSLALHPVKGPTGTVELELNAPSVTGEFKITLMVSAETSADGESDPSDNTYEVVGLKVVDGRTGPDRTVLYISLGVGLLLLLGIVGGGIYLWRRDDGPERPEDTSGQGIMGESAGVSVTPDDGTGEIEGSVGAEPEKESDDIGMPVLTMDLMGGAEEGTIVAEVLDEPPEETQEMEGTVDEGEGLIPEI